jgi:hypothetical protein|tara:strand:- start:1525 stop:2301 length:777 start_codon:yes stop_codon:yes gene_type:complete
MTALCDSMTKVTLDSKEWVALLSSFGTKIEDIELTVSANKISYLVSHSTHAVRFNKTYSTGIESTGFLVFTDLKNTKAFLNKSKGDVTISQMRNRIVLQNGKKSMTLPVHSCNSSQLSQTISKLLIDCEEKDWALFGKKTVLDNHADANLSELVDSLSVAKGLNKDSDYTMKFNAEENELLLQVRKTGGVSFSCYVNTENSDGGNSTVSSSFGSWLLDALSSLKGNHTSRIHLGDSTPIIIEQNGDGWDTTLLIIDQE